MTFINETTFDKLELPDRLYKYRSWNNQQHRRIITHSEIYFAQFLDFGELHECNLERDYSAITEEAFYEYHKAKCPPDTPDEKIRGAAKYLMKHSPIFDKDHQRTAHEMFRQKLNNTLSVFCACDHNNNLNLWNTFAIDHEGYCVGLNTRKMFDNGEIFGSGGKVNYYPKANPPKIRALPKSNEERVTDLMNVIYSLPDTFASEKEYRLTKANLENRKVKINSTAIEEIILGENMDQDDKNEIIQLVKNNFPNASIQQASYNESLNTFSFVAI